MPYSTINTSQESNNDDVKINGIGQTDHTFLLHRRVYFQCGPIKSA